VAFFSLQAAMLGQGEPQAKAKPEALRQRLAGLKSGMSSDQVLQVLGQPDEVRRVPEDHLLDGTRLLGDQRGVGPETERWAYGIRARGKFTRIGFVSLDRNGKVVAAVPADRLADRRTSPKLAPAQADGAVASPAKLSCHVAAVQLIPAAGETAAHL